jgi:SPP1 gp7 family putative phage head morphogenesis protein
MKSTRSREIYQYLERELVQPTTRRAIEKIIRENANEIRSIPLDLAKRVTKYTAAAQASGLRSGAVEKELQKRLAHLSAGKIKLIARTELSRSHTAITEVRSTELGIPAYVWTSSEDQRVRPSHHNMNGVIVFWKDAPQPEELINLRSTLGHYHAGGAPNCFTGECKVFSPSAIKTLWRAPYSGDIVRIEVESGDFFCATPNHPILTEYGWVAAGALDEGNHVFHLRNGGDAFMQPNMNDGIPTFHDVFDSESLCGYHRSVFGLDFHGDVIRDNIDQIAVAQDLYFDRHPDAAHGIGDLAFANANSRIANVIAGVASEIVGARRPRISDELSSLFRRELIHSDSIGCRAISSLDVVCDEVFSNHISRDFQMERYALLAPFFNDIEISENLRIDDAAQASDRGLSPVSGLDERNRQMTLGASVALTKRFDAFTGEQRLIRVTKKSVSKFSGHVFTMETDAGIFGVTSAGIISKNCRCEPLPLASVDEVTWPARVYRHNAITRMTQAQFLKLPEMRKAA